MRVAAADWSGSRRPGSTWLAECDASGRLVGLAATTPVQIVDRLRRLAGDDLVVGFDFSFSLPARWLRQQHIATAAELWADAARLETWLERCEPPFWGRPGRRRPPGPPEDGYRLTELACAPRPRSGFQVGGAGSVGTASLRGMPHLAALRSAGFAVWPFDPWRPPVLVEAWPRLALGRLVKSDPAARAAWVGAQGRRVPPALGAVAASSADALDAAAAALSLFERAGPHPRPDDPVICELEGWIEGVPFAVTPSGPGAAGAPPAAGAGRRHLQQARQVRSERAQEER